MRRRARIDYTNWRGERRSRVIEPVSIMFASNEWHSEKQWLLNARDCEDDERIKTFAMGCIHSWEPAP